MLFKRNNTIEPTTIEAGYDYMNGPKHYTGLGYQWFYTERDWNPNLGLLWIRPVNPIQRGSVDGECRKMDKEEFADFLKNCKLCKHVVVLTRKAYGPWPEHINLIRRNDSDNWDIDMNGIEKMDYETKNLIDYILS